MRIYESNQLSPMIYQMMKQSLFKSDVMPSKPSMTPGVNNQLNVHEAVLGATTADMTSGTANLSACAFAVRNMATLFHSVAGLTLYATPENAVEQP